jgi:hypothetical protein
MPAKTLPSSAEARLNFKLLPQCLVPRGTECIWGKEPAPALCRFAASGKAPREPGVTQKAPLRSEHGEPDKPPTHQALPQTPRLTAWPRRPMGHQRHTFPPYRRRGFRYSLIWHEPAEFASGMADRLFEPVGRSAPGRQCGPPISRALRAFLLVGVQLVMPTMPAREPALCPSSASTTCSLTPKRSNPVASVRRKS